MKTKNQKLNLKNLKVASFVTSLENRDSLTVIGGRQSAIKPSQVDLPSVGQCTAAGPNTEGCCN